MFVATTEFSLGQSLLSTDDVVNMVDGHSLSRVVVTDTMSLTSMIPLAEKLKEKLVMGVRLNLIDEAVQERMPVYGPKVYPVDQKGVELLYQFLTKSFERPYFYEIPRVDWRLFNELLSAAPASFVVSTGDIGSLLKHSRAEQLIEQIRSILPAGNLVFDICPVPTALFDRLTHTGLSLLTDTDRVNLYVPAFYKKDDADVFPIHFSISKNVEFNYLKPTHTDFYYEPGREKTLFRNTLQRIKERYGFTPKKMTLATFDGMYQWKAQTPRLPKLAADPAKTLRDLSVKGFKERLTKSIYGYKPTFEKLKEEYLPRLDSELEIINKLNFGNYFLMVYELTSWCRKQGIRIGPGRGSVGGSLVAFCLGITDVDPIRFELMFERFINPTRLDLPDIDLDFMSERRHEIVEHLVDRYGADNVCGIINYSTLGSKSALRSTCRILGLNELEYSCSKLIPSNFGFTVPLDEAADKVIEVKNFANKHPDHWKKAKKLENKLRNFSTHAAGIIVSDRPLTQDAVIEVRKGTRIVNWDKQLCEKQGLIKLDVLGLKCLDMIELTIKYIQKRHGVTIDPQEIELSDAKVLNAFATGETRGVFQFEGGGAKKILSRLSRHEPLTFDDLVATNALNRPGPIEAGLVDLYISGKNGDLHDVEHSSMAEALEPTYNVMCYQEQVMKVAVEFAGYTLPEADNLRKIMGKKLPEAMKKEADKFIDGAARTHGVSPALGKEIFDQISKFAFYAFNKSHSVEYSLLSYICMWLKVYYPVEYYAASLNYVDDKKVAGIINEARKTGITIDPPSINHSTDLFVPTGTNRIVAPLSKIKYVQAAATAIMLERDTNGPYKSIEDLEARTEKRLVNVRVIRAMEAVGALDEIKPGTGSICPVERSRALNEYLPSIPLGHVTITRKMAPSASDKSKLNKLFEECEAKDKNFVRPFLGKEPLFMVIVDSASKTEAKNGQFTMTKAFGTIESSLAKADLSKANGYWTGVVKREKTSKEKTFDNATLEAGYKILREEIALLRPPVILALGNAANKMFYPELKGSAVENAGKIIYDKATDTNIVIGFNPNQIIFNDELGEVLTELFEQIGEML